MFNEIIEPLYKNYNKYDEEFVFAILILMIVLFIIDFIFYRSKNPKDMKSSIVSLGVLGTFVGIFFGLYGFDSQNISESIPSLLDGLRFAFITSILGMFLSTLLTFLQTLFNKSIKTDSNPDNLLIDKIDALSKEIRNGTIEFTQHLKELVKLNRDESLSVRALISNFNKDMSVSTELIIERVDEHKGFMKQCADESVKNFKNFLENEFSKTNESLEKSIKLMAEGANKEIIIALENVIKDFNNNLTESFGDNFKQLNEAVKDILVWQNNYKDQVEQNTKHLSEVVKAVEQTSSTIGEIEKRSSSAQNIYESIKGIIESYNVHVNSLSSHLEQIDGLGVKAATAFTNISSGHEKVSEEVNGFVKELREALPESLGNLEATLVGITEKFAQDYQSMLEQSSSRIRE